MNEDIPLAPLVLVHPFYAMGRPSYVQVHDTRDPLVDYCLTGTYLDQLNVLLRRDREPILLFEEQRQIQSTRMRLQEVSRTRDVWIIPTWPDSPEPWSFDWNNTLQLAACFGNRFHFAGGCLYGHESRLPEYGGCLGTVFETFKKSGLEGYFVKGCCFR